MTISVGDRLPDARLLKPGKDGPEEITLSERLKGRRVILFGVPGAFTRTCHSAHVPSFIRTRAAFAEKDIDEVICVSVNDPFVMGAWGTATGATDAGITMLADADGSLTSALGLSFDAPATGLLGRSRRYALLAEDGVVRVLRIEEARGTCELSGGEAMLEAI